MTPTTEGSTCPGRNHFPSKCIVPSACERMNERRSNISWLIIIISRLSSWHGLVGYRHQEPPVQGSLPATRNHNISIGSCVCVCPSPLSRLWCGILCAGNHFCTIKLARKKRNHQRIGQPRWCVSYMTSHLYGAVVFPSCLPFFRIERRCCSLPTVA